MSSVTADASVLSTSIEYGLQKMGYDRIKPEQLGAVQSVLRGDSVFMSVPTGFGKSLVYQLLPLCAKSLLQSSGRTEPTTPIVVVVSPLLSLMHDQVSKLVAKSVQAVYISDATSNRVHEDILDGRVTHVFGSPEAFVGSKKWRTMFLDKALSKRVVAIAIDEAHCIVKW